MNVNHHPRSLTRFILFLILFMLSAAVLPTPNWQGQAAIHAGLAQAMNGEGIDNGRPKLSSLSVNPVEIEEGGYFVLSGLLANSSPDNEFTVTIDWGDGQSSTKEFKHGSTSFSFNHRAMDDNPSGTASDSYVITAVLADNSEPFSSATAVIKVNNVPPTVDIGPNLTRYLGQRTLFLASIRDPGTTDTHSVRWDFGDGSALQEGREAEHIFTQAGTYTVTATATDDDGGSGKATIQVGVTAVGYLPFVGS